MKKIILLFLIIPSVCFLQTKGHIETGKDIHSSASYVEMQIGYIFKPHNLILYPYGNSITWYSIDDYKGNPFRNIYTVGTDLKYTDLTFNIEHFCSHAVLTTRENNHRYNDIPMGGQMTKISIRLDF